MLDEPQEPAGAEAHEGVLRRSPRHREPGEHPEADVPEPEEPEEDDLGGALAQGRDGPSHRRQAVLGHDVDIGPLAPKLVGEAACGRIVAFADAGGENQDPGGHGADEPNSANGRRGGSTF